MDDFRKASRHGKFNAMNHDTISHRTRIWRWSAEGKGAWHFITVDGDAGHELSAMEAMRRLELGHRRGFGSIKVNLQIGETRWQTSAFPKKGREAWDIPLRKSALKAEDLREGDDVEVRIEPV